MPANHCLQMAPFQDLQTILSCWNWGWRLGSWVTACVQRPCFITCVCWRSVKRGGMSQKIRDLLWQFDCCHWGLLTQEDLALRPWSLKMKRDLSKNSLVLGKIHRKLVSLPKWFWCPEVSTTARGAGTWVLAIWKWVRAWSCVLEGLVTSCGLI